MSISAARPVFCVRSRRGLRTRSLVLTLAPWLVAGCGEFGLGASDTGEAAAEATTPVAGPQARITQITGPAGVHSPELPEGTLLGAGARLEPGQTITTPKSTLAEIELGEGSRLRLNEATELIVPTATTAPIVLTRGEIVVSRPVAETGPREPLRIKAGADIVRLEVGELHARTEPEGAHFAVVSGNAVLETGSEEIHLGPGQSIDTPVIAGAELVHPERSLRPLRETDWASTFDAAARLADEVPRGVGSLTARRPGSSEEHQQLRLVDQRISVNISGRIAHTEVEQAFFNDRGAVLEGIYRFPLPSDASISGLGLLVGNTWMQGEIVEKQRARAIFKEIVDATIPRDPALLEWERGNVFKLRVFPIPGRGDRRVRLSWTQILPTVGGKLRYRYPLGGSGATNVPIDHFSFTVNLDRRGLDQEDLDNLRTPMLALQREDQAEQVTLHTERENFLPTFDLGVDVPLAQQSVAVSASTHLDRDGQAYFMVALDPKLELPDDNRPTDFAFVLDRSHSTTIELWTTARGIVDALADMMGEGDRFTVIACDSACDEHEGGLQAASEAAVDRSQEFLERQDLAGASDIGGALETAAASLRQGARDARRVIVYLGDGAPSSGELAADKLVARVHRSLAGTSVLAVALGARSDLTTLGAVVKDVGGDLVTADARDDLRALVRELQLRAQVPALRDVQFDLPEGLAVVRQHNVSAIRPGDTVMLVGKLRHPVSGEITMRGEGPGGPVAVRFPVDLAAVRSDDSRQQHLPRTWAAMQIAELTQTGGFDARAEIVKLSEDYTVLSRFTALLVLENDAMYREFNVVRAAKTTDKWDGGFSTNKAKVASRTRAAPRASAAPEPDDISGADGRSARDQRERQAEEKAESGVLDAFDKEARGPQPGGVAGGILPPASVAGGIPGGVAGGVIGGVGGEVSNDLGLSGTGRGGGSTGSKSGFADPPPPAELPRDPDFGDAKERPLSRHDVQPDPEPEPVVSEDEDGDDARPRVPKAKKAPPASKPEPWPYRGDEWIEDLGKSVSRPERAKRRPRDRTPHVAISTKPTPSRRAVARLASLVDTVRTHPTQRSAHSELVRTAIAVGHTETLQFARAWAQVDPEHPPALRSLADALARAGDPRAARAYDSVVEIRPFSTSEHALLADAFEIDHDLPRSCSHRLALVSIDPSQGRHHAGLARCLARAGRLAAGHEALADGQRRATRGRAALASAAAELASGTVSSLPPLPRSAALRVTLRWTGEDDLEIALVDARGRRLSGLRPEQVQVRKAAGTQELTLRRVRRPVFVEVTRKAGDAPNRQPSISAQLEIRTPSRRKNLSLTATEGTTRQAKVFWTAGR